MTNIKNNADSLHDLQNYTAPDIEVVKLETSHQVLQMNSAGAEITN